MSAYCLSRTLLDVLPMVLHEPHGSCGPEALVCLGNRHRVPLVWVAWTTGFTDPLVLEAEA